MSAIQGAFGVLLGFLNLLLKFSLTSCCVFCVALTSHLEDGTYLGACLAIAFFGLFFCLLLVPNSQLITGFSPFLRLLGGHPWSQFWAFVILSAGFCFLVLGIAPRVMFAREVCIICMAASLAIILPVTRLEVMGKDQLAVRDTALGGSDTTAPAGPSNKGGKRSDSSARYWQKLSCCAVALLVLVCVACLSAQSRTDTRADGIVVEQIMVNDTSMVNDTVIVNDICLLPPEMPAKANLTATSIPVSTPGFITTLGTPCQATTTPAPPSPVAKSTWVPAAKSTPMPTPEPTPTALPEVEPEPEVDLEREVHREQELQPIPAAAAPQDAFGAFELLCELLSNEAKSVLSSQAESVQSSYLSLRVEDRCAAFVVALVLAWLLFSRLAPVVISSGILPMSCLPSTGLFFCLTRSGLTRDQSLIICAAVCLVLMAAVLAGAFFTQLLKLLKPRPTDVNELPKVQADVSKITGDVSTIAGDLSMLQDDTILIKRNFGNFKTETEQSTAKFNGWFDKYSSQLRAFQGAFFVLCMIIGGLARRLNFLESSAKTFSKRIDGLHEVLSKLRTTKADSEDIDNLRKELEEAKDQFAAIKDTGADDEAREKLQGKLDELSDKVNKLCDSVGLLPARVDGLEKETRDNISRLDKNSKATGKRLSDVEDENKSTQERLKTLEDCQAAKDDLEPAQDVASRADTDRQHKTAMDAINDQAAGIDRQHTATMEAINQQGTNFDQRLQDSQHATGDLVDEKVKASENDRRADQAALKSKFDERFQSSDDKVDRLQKQLDAQNAAADERYEKLLKRFDELENNRSEDQINSYIEVQVIQRLQVFFTRERFLVIVCAAMLLAMQHMMMEQQGHNNANFPGAPQEPMPDTDPSDSPPPIDNASDDRGTSNAPNELSDDDPPSSANNTDHDQDTSDAPNELSQEDPPSSSDNNDQDTSNAPDKLSQEDPPSSSDNADQDTSNAPDKLSHEDQASPTNNMSDGHTPSDACPGLNPTGHSQGPSGAAPSSSSPEADGSRASNGPGGNTSDGSNGEKKPNRRRGHAKEKDSTRRQNARQALNGKDITATGDVVDEKNNKLGSVTLLDGITVDLTHVGNVVKCDEQGYIRDKSNKPIARVWLLDETPYVCRVKKDRDDAQGGAADDTSRPGFPSRPDEHDDGASSQSSGDHGSSSATRDPSSSSDPTDSPPSAGHTGPSSGGPGSSSFRGPSGSPTSPIGSELPSEPSGSPPSSAHPAPSSSRSGPEPALPSGGPGSSSAPGGPGIRATGLYGSRFAPDSTLGNDGSGSSSSPGASNPPSSSDVLGPSAGPSGVQPSSGRPGQKNGLSGSKFAPGSSSGSGPASSSAGGPGKNKGLGGSKFAPGSSSGNRPGSSSSSGGPGQNKGLGGSKFAPGSSSSFGGPGSASGSGGRGTMGPSPAPPPPSNGGFDLRTFFNDPTPVLKGDGKNIPASMMGSVHARK